MAQRKLKPIEERDPYAAHVLATFDQLAAQSAAQHLPPLRVVNQPNGHEFDDDAVCIHCGFDGAEWHHWKHHTYEGKAQPEAKQPLCTRA